MALDEHELRAWVRRVAEGKASRRDFIPTLLGLGLSGPLIAEILATPAFARAQGAGGAPQPLTPTRREGGGKLRLLYWQAPTVLTAHFSRSAMDWDASRVVCESEGVSELLIPYQMGCPNS